MTDIDRVRGNPPDQINLTTSRFPYNPKIVIGDRYIVFTSPGNSYVDICTEFATADGIGLWATFLLRDYGNCGRTEDRLSALFHPSREFLDQDWTLTTQMVIDLLDVFRQRNLELRVRRTNEHIIVKGFGFRFSEDSLVGLKWVDCDV